MIDFQSLVPECNVDTVFVESVLGYKNPNHAPGISDVMSIMQNNRPNQTVIGFIDDDKKKPLYLKEFREIDRMNRVKLLRHPKRNHFLVIVKPAMDVFLHNLCKEHSVNPADYQFPKGRKEFISFTKSESIRDNHHFKNLLNSVKQKKPPEIMKIAAWVRTRVNN